MLKIAFKKPNLTRLFASLVALGLVSLSTQAEASPYLFRVLIPLSLADIETEISNSPWVESKPGLYTVRVPAHVTVTATLAGAGGGGGGYYIIGGGNGGFGVATFQSGNSPLTLQVYVGKAGVYNPDYLKGTGGGATAVWEGTGSVYSASSLAIVGGGGGGGYLRSYGDMGGDGGGFDQNGGYGFSQQNNQYGSGGVWCFGPIRLAAGSPSVQTQDVGDGGGGDGGGGSGYDKPGYAKLTW